MPETPEPIDLDAFATEVENGLPNERRRLDGADENQAWYDHDAERYLPRREAESEFDFEGRPKRESGLLRECVEILCDHLYNPGPTRRLRGGARRTRSWPGSTSRTSSIRSCSRPTCSAP
ncbi:MAG: hypothetical protein ACM35G_03400 [Planctomycetaceae bacterium]